MKLSILILTHNRPQLFKRCLESVLKQLPNDAEVIVNNDSRDIEEIPHPQVIYHYHKPNTLCDIYKFLLEQSKGEYVYYLEDDDYLADDFTSIPLTADLIVGNYYPTYSPTYLIECLGMYDNELVWPEVFREQMNLEHLQLSQHIFKRKSILDFNFTADNNVHNDIRLVLHASTRSNKVQMMKKVFFYQTIDGGDNISFPESNHSVNTTQTLDFLEDYGLQAPTPYTARP
jgi:glycosyltransferase involved in cell wall biosynthesis